MPGTRRIGMHIRTGRGLDRAAQSVKDLGLDTVALFTGNPSAWRSAPVDAGATDQFRQTMRALDVHPVLSHAMYLINLASPNPTFYQKSQDALVAELSRAQAYGCADAVTHVGSHMGEGREAGITRVVRALDAVLGRSQSPVGLLLEISAGGGAYIGSRFEDLAEILDRLPQHAPRLGVCFDTAHAYASGYDLAGAEPMAKAIDRLTALVPAARIRAVHCNDTTVECGGKGDRHHHIGQGHIGMEGFRALLHHPALAHAAFILETPGEERIEGVQNLTTLRELAQ
ncbi:MAG TPA: deoxyribonuclease IV [Candidatus Limnocylindrales bacterium]|nr:deoxyribonuclease IV [Candidatus Limnocylindrales bacterium]